ncbi:MAG: Ubiquinone/menaquinone biosynthesis C-methyltransferase UbiE [Acidobacteria bacterium]|nr:Ubiquinone/menaquinone biosynthesis C-methyltransferase UbiE [Acidobacteriota bacterium]
MQTEDYEYLYKLEENFWWFAGMREITAALLDPFLPSRDRVILDAGCGTGGNLEWLARYAGGGRVAGIDLVSTALKFCRERNHGQLAQASATDLPFADESFDLVTSFDVLVQIPGHGADEQAMREMFRVLKPGGVAFVRGAAFEWMKSGHDRALDTQRRYSLGELREKLRRAGFEILRETYANSLLFPIAAIRRLALKRLGLADKGSDVKPLPKNMQWLNRALTNALLWEARHLRDPNAKLPAGLSAICVASKSDQYRER